MDIDSKNNIYFFDGYLSGNLSKSEEIKLSEWLKQSEQNYMLFKDYVKSNQFSLAHSDETDQSWERFRIKITNQESTDRINKVASLTWLKVAAIFIMSFILGGLAVYFLNGDRFFNTNQLADLIEINAPKGSKSFVRLPDGSQVWLNSDSKLFYSPEFGKKDRIVELIGEAYFAVEKNTAIPFRVNTSEITVNVTGTMFNLKAYPGEKTIETTLEEGEVILNRRDAKRKKDVVVLKPKQRAILNTNVNKIIVTDSRSKKINLPKKEIEKAQTILVDENIDTELYTSWKENKLVFRNESLDEVFVRLERWYGVKINVEDDEVFNYHFNGTIDNETITQVMKIMQYALPIQFDIDHNVITIDKK